MDTTSRINDALRLYSSGVTSRMFLEREVHAWEMSSRRAKEKPGAIIDLEADRDGVWRTRSPRR